ncbi:hypothetical protein GGTG_05508 [Gaeumannomyces tritici R3-111a-1]|uniref:Uncharacterized protein n=1 Tax=Gaeumannomyces tritici (strain R3-111a-1) TaxID=644352 RepID=J3NW45_GAET3|nr:hypothetical protein GGTG_05508 [Gaeumannomyces tritici R3-111a-1]EJT75575.1 hypothetical protein GGTG_05508 [Gaeumannomyces tritici R3-111a-1]
MSDQHSIGGDDEAGPGWLGGGTKACCREGAAGQRRPSKAMSARAGRLCRVDLAIYLHLSSFPRSSATADVSGAIQI